MPCRSESENGSRNPSVGSRPSEPAANSATSANNEIGPGSKWKQPSTTSSESALSTPPQPDRSSAARSERAQATSRHEHHRNRPAKPANQTPLRIARETTRVPNFRTLLAPSCSGSRLVEAGLGLVVCGVGGRAVLSGGVAACEASGWCGVGLAGWVGCVAVAGEPRGPGQIWRRMVPSRSNASTRLGVQGQLLGSRQKRWRPVVMMWPAVWKRQ